MTINNIIELAQSQLGVKESPANSNKVIYNNFFYGKVVSGSAYPWCATFIYWLFCQFVGGRKIIYKSAGAGYIPKGMVNKGTADWIMKQNCSSSTRKSALAKAKAGDICCFDFGAYDGYQHHIGLIVNVTSAGYECIEGNTSKAGSQSNGGMVCLKTRKWSDVCMIARPHYDGADEQIDYSIVVDGQWGTATTVALQRVLGVTIDGELGKNTYKALQKIIGTPADGVFGKNSWLALQRWLNANGFTDYKGKKLVEDGVKGVATISAMQKWLNARLKPEPKPEPTPQHYSGEYPNVVVTTKKTYAEKIASRAEANAWAYGTASSKSAYPNGSPYGGFKADLNKAYPNRSSWGDAPKVGASCDVAVGTIVRACGADSNFPRGLDEQFKYLKTVEGFSYDKPNYSNLKRGDLIIYSNSKGGHVCIALGNGRVAEAGYEHYWMKITGYAKTRVNFTGAKIYHPTKTYLETREYLQMGDKGSEVLKMQKFLAWAGYDLGKCGCDSDFGQATKSALTKFQSDVKITADGLCDKETVSKMEEYTK